MLTQAILKNLLHYDPLTGIFTWIKNRGGTAMAGEIAGTLCKDKYKAICVCQKKYSEHHLAWLYIYGEFPLGEIDHKDGNRANNAIDNLRISTRSQNAFNTKIRKHSTTGFKGVERAGKKFQARLRVNGVRYCLGCYATPEQAHAARNAKAKELHGKFFRAQ